MGLVVRLMMLGLVGFAALAMKQPKLAALLLAMLLLSLALLGVAASAANERQRAQQEIEDRPPYSYIAIDCKNVHWPHNGDMYGPTCYCEQVVNGKVTSHWRVPYRPRMYSSDC
jgi:hypothetical protein